MSGAGLSFHVIALSAQSLGAPNTAGPSTVAAGGVQPQLRARDGAREAADQEAQVALGAVARAVVAVERAWPSRSSCRGRAARRARPPPGRTSASGSRARSRRTAPGRPRRRSAPSPCGSAPARRTSPRTGARSPSSVCGDGAETRAGRVRHDGLRERCRLRLRRRRPTCAPAGEESTVSWAVRGASVTRPGVGLAVRVGGGQSHLDLGRVRVVGRGERAGRGPREVADLVLVAVPGRRAVRAARRSSRAAPAAGAPSSSVGGRAREGDRVARAPGRRSPRGPRCSRRARCATVIGACRCRSPPTCR